MLFRVVLAAAPLFLFGCSTNSGVAPEGLGAGLGAVAGGVAGNQFGSGKTKAATTILGAAAGGIVGFGLGQWLAPHDQAIAESTQQSALERGQSRKQVAWTGGQNSSRGEFTPGAPYKLGTRHCRDYTHTIYVGSRPQSMNGTACRNPDGTWSKA